MEKFNTHNTESIEKSRKAELFAVFMSVLVAAFAGKQEALEIPNGTNWYEGARLFQKASLEQKNEWAGAFALNAEGEGSFIKPIEGMENEVSNNLGENMKVLFENIGSIERMCDIHTHPLSTILETGSGRTGPGWIDIFNRVNLDEKVDIYNTFKKFPQTDSQAEYFGTVFSPNGVWYHQYDASLVSPDKQLDALRADPDFYPSLQAASPQDPTQELSPEQAQKIKEIYAEYGTKIRYVPYSKLDAEPPCAGPNYEAPAAEPAAIGR